MIVYLKLYADRTGKVKAEGEPPVPVDLPLESTLAELLAFKRVRSDYRPLFLVNGVDATPDRVLKDGDVVSVLGPIAG